MTSSILLIGASGRTGLQIIRAASTQPNSPAIHAFVRTPSKLPARDTSLCASVIRGDALHAEDLSRALKSSGADTVIISVGRVDVGPTDLREKSAEALMQVIKPGTSYDHVRIVCISSDGAGGTKIQIGLGIGKALSFYLRHILKDHDKQEEVLKRGLGDNSRQKRRLLILHPTGLTSDKATGNVVEFGDEKAPSSRIDRADLAKWIVGEVCGNGKRFGSAVCLTGGK